MNYQSNRNESIGSINNLDIIEINEKFRVIQRLFNGIFGINGNNLLSLTDIISGLSENKIVSTNSDGEFVSVDDLTSFILGTTRQITSTDNTDGTLTLSLPSDILVPSVITIPNTGLHILDSDASHDLIIKAGSNQSSDRTLTINVGDANRSITLSGDLTVELVSIINQDVTSDADVTFNQITLSGLTASMLASSNASKSISSVTDLTNFIAGTSGEITVTNDGDGTITISLPSDIVIPDGGTIGQSAGPLLTFDDTGNHLEISGCSVLIGDTLNSNMTKGLTINQISADDELFSGKSADVRHGLTDQTETDTYVLIEKVSANGGGLNLKGFQDGDGYSYGTLYLTGYQQVAADTTTTTSALGLITLKAVQHNGANVTSAVAADGNCLVVSNNNDAEFIVKGDGDIYYNGADQGAFDSYDDAKLIRAFDLLVNPSHITRNKYDDNNFYCEQTLKRTKLISYESKPMINLVQTNRLHNGAIWQARLLSNAIIDTLEDIIPDFKTKLKENLDECIELH